jgi:hypothetical protein
MWPTLREIKVLKSVNKLYFEQKLEKVGKKTIKKHLNCTSFKIWEMT